MSSDQTYHGWANRETWTVHLWLTSEEQAYASCREIAEDCAAELEDERAFDATVGEQIKARWVEPLVESAGPSDGLVCDLIGCALARVDWREIGRAFREA